MVTKQKHKHLQSFTSVSDRETTSFVGTQVQTFSDIKHVDQRRLIRRILTALGSNKNVEDAAVNFRWSTRGTPAVKPLRIKDLSGTPRKTSWDCRSANRVMMHLTGSATPYLEIKVQQATHFSMGLKSSHEN